MKSSFESGHALGLGLWIDGVPFNWDRSESIEVVSMSLPGLADGNSNLRIPVCVVSKCFMLKDVTYEDILDVVAWSFVWLAQGLFPPRRHDDASFRQGTDNRRIKLANQQLSMKGFLCELRGDWKMLSEVLKIPYWNNKEGICFKCNATLTTLRNFSSEADWRDPANRRSHWDFCRHLASKGLKLSNIFKAPGFSTSCICFDWLRCMDLGVCADFLGNIFWLLLEHQSGSSRKEKVRSLYLKMLDYYQTHGVQDKLKGLTELMLRKKQSASPKLRCSAVQARALVEFARQECQSSLVTDDIVEETAKAAAIHLGNCYRCLSHEHFNADDLLRESIKFCQLYGGLEMHAKAKGSNCWKVKPKFHTFQEMCLQGDNPALCWTYRDEDMGGYIAMVAKRRGGKNSVLSTGRTVLNKFKAKQKPALR
jgi:hypothetical protein